MPTFPSLHRSRRNIFPPRDRRDFSREMESWLKFEKKPEREREKREAQSQCTLLHFGLNFQGVCTVFLCCFNGKNIWNKRNLLKTAQDNHFRLLLLFSERVSSSEVDALISPTLLIRFPFFSFLSPVRRGKSSVGRRMGKERMLCPENR